MNSTPSLILYETRLHFLVCNFGLLLDAFMYARYRHEFIEEQVTCTNLADLFQVTESVPFFGIGGICVGDISGPSNIAIHRVLL